MSVDKLDLEDTLLLYIITILVTLFVALILPVWLGKGIFYIIDLFFNINLIKDYGQQRWALYWLIGMGIVTILAIAINGVIDDRHKTKSNRK